MTRYEPNKKLEQQVQSDLDKLMAQAHSELTRRLGREPSEKELAEAFKKKLK